MTHEEAVETVLAMAKVQDGYAKRATDPGLKLIHKANAKAQREVAACIADLKASRDFWENRENEAVLRAEAAEAALARLREEQDAMVGAVIAEATNDLTDAEARSAALSYRHDLGLLPPRDQEAIAREAKWWHHALSHRLRALRPDAAAALERVRQEARNAALEEAIARLDTILGEREAIAAIRAMKGQTA